MCPMTDHYNNGILDDWHDSVNTQNDRPDLFKFHKKKNVKSIRFHEIRKSTGKL